MPATPEEETQFVQVIRMRLRAARLNLGLRQHDIAGRIGIEPRNYQRIESLTLDKRINPGILTLRQIAKALEMNLSDLIVEPTVEELEALSGKLSTERAKRHKSV